MPDEPEKQQPVAQDDEDPRLRLPVPKTSRSATYTAHCHCGAVRLSFALSPPLPEHPVRRCNCSVCARNGYLLVYPHRADLAVTVEAGAEGLRTYTFGKRRNKHRFCGGCGSSVFFDPEIGVEGMDILGVNVSCADLLSTSLRVLLGGRGRGCQGRASVLNADFGGLDVRRA